ncbi:MAG: TonB-dependent receptor [Bacteroidetes bacterium]|nr:TonB-dependent receptor [Bacteroidota bacterium]
MDRTNETHVIIEKAAKSINAACIVLVKVVLIAVLLLLLFAPTANAQGGIDSLEFITIKGYQPTIANTVKLSEQPSFKDSTKKIIVPPYVITPKKVNTVFVLEEIKPAKMVGEPLTKLYRSMLKVGAGNYATSYAEYLYSNLRSREVNYGLHMKHFSSQATLKNYGFSGLSTNSIDIFGKKFLAKHTISGNFLYDRNVVHHYGYDTEKHNLSKNAQKQVFNYLNPVARIVSHIKDSSKINYDITLQHHFFRDIYEAKENNFSASGILTTYYDHQLITLNSGVDFYANSMPTDTFNNTIIKLNPSIKSGGKTWEGELGVSVFTDISQEATIFKFYPSINFHYHVIDDIFIAYTGFTGGLSRNSFRTLAFENNFITPNLTLKNTDNVFNAFLGIKGSVSTKDAYNLHATYSRYRNMALFSVDTTEILYNKFNTVYDDVMVLDVTGEFQYQTTEKMKIISKASFFNYQTTTESNTWYKPNVQVSAGVNYNLRDKIVAKADLFYVGKRSAQQFANSKLEPITLQSFVDVNIGAEYKYSKLISAYVNFNNLSATRYLRWNNYPTQRFNLLVGASIAF